MAQLLEIKDLHVEVEGKKILNGLSLGINRGELHAVMGPNGSGKSTLAMTLLGHPNYLITSGDVLYKGESIIGLSPDERARKGVFLAFQYPTAIPGVSIASFLRLAYLQKLGIDPTHTNKNNGQPQQDSRVQQSVRDFLKKLKSKMSELGLEHSFISRSVNEGFSGGEKKRLEILQLSLLEPELSILDETDSGLDIDALKTVSEGINNSRNSARGYLVITHYQRILNYLKPDIVHILIGGKIVQSGGPDLAMKLEEKGYDWAREELAAS